jgi:hypothetical protein
MNWFGHLKVRLFPPVTQRMALTIAKQALAQSKTAEPLICRARKPTHFCVYACFPEPCWWVQAPWNDETEGIAIRSSRVIVIGRQSGKVFYDGPAGDEG